MLALVEVTNDIENLLRKIEAWHQGSVAGYRFMYRDADGYWGAIYGLSQTALRIRKTKTCACCQRRKPLTEYHRCKAYRDGLYRRCKACSTLSRRQRYLKNRERALE